VELGPNIHQQDPATGEWRQASPTIQATNDGAVLDFGGFHASFAANHHSSGAFSVTTPTGETLTGHVLGVCYQDMVSGLSGFIATTKDSVGAVEDGKRIVYHDAFSAISADLVYNFSKGAVEQDVVFSAFPPDPTALGMNPTSTLVQVVTEFLAPPQPSVNVRYFTNTMCSANGASIAVEDDKIEFESVAFGFGQSFARHFDRADRLSPTVVQRWWRNIDGRAVLIESVPYVAIIAMAESAGLGAPANQLPSIAASPVLQLPPVPNSAPGAQMLLVTNAQFSPGVVMDWIAVPQINGSYTFNSGTTYAITGQTYFSGPVTLALGTIVKYHQEACVNFSGGVTFNGGPQGWTVLTAVDDQTVGQAIPNSAPVPSGYYADWAMVIWGPGGTPFLCDVRFAKRGIFFYTGGTGTISCVNAIGCGTAAGGFGTTVYWEGGYWCDVSTGFEDDYEATLAAYPNSLAVDLLGLANGQVVSGTVTLPVVFGNTDTNGNAEAFILTDTAGDPPLTGTSFLTNTPSGDCVLGTWDTTQIANGNYTIVAEAVMSDGTSLVGSPITVTAHNLLWFPNQWNFAGDLIYIGAQTPYTDGTGTWQIDAYTNGAPFGYLTGWIDTSGYLALDGHTGPFSVSNTNASGNQYSATCYDLYFFTDSAHPIQVGAHKRVPVEGSRWRLLATNTSICTCAEMFPSQWQTAQEDEAAMNAIVGTAENFWHVSQLSTFSGAPMFQIPTIYPWSSMLYGGMNQYTCRDFIYTGHGSSNSIGDSGATLSAATVAAALGNNATADPPYNFQPYRFVYMDGCDTASGNAWPEAFGIPPQTGLTTTNFYDSGLRPRAFMGWNKDKWIDIQGQGIMNPAHFTYVQTFWLKWSGQNRDGTYNTLQTSVNAAKTAAGVAAASGMVIYGASDLYIWE
jgi:hypothetical protein